MTFFLSAAKTFGLTGSPTSLSAWAGSVLAVAGICGLFAVARRSVGGIIRVVLEKTLNPAMDELACPPLPMEHRHQWSQRQRERSFDSVEKPLVLNSEYTQDLPMEDSGLGDGRRSWTGKVLAMAKGTMGDWRGKVRTNV